MSRYSITFLNYIPTHNNGEPQHKISVNQCGMENSSSKERYSKIVGFLVYDSKNIFQSNFTDYKRKEISKNSMSRYAVGHRFFQRFQGLNPALIKFSLNR